MITASAPTAAETSRFGFALLKVFKWPIGVLCGTLAALLLLPALIFVNGFEWAFGIKHDSAANL
jgi:hypothetical protein